MADHESHPIRDGIIATVVGGIILAVIPFTRTILVNIGEGIGNGIAITAITIWNHLITRAKVPWFFIWLLCGFALWTLWQWIRPLFHKGKREPNIQDYLMDHFHGITWKWSYGYGHTLLGISAFCPLCQTRLIYSEGRYPERTTFHCESCNRNMLMLDGDFQFALSAIARQIERRINTGEWKSVLNARLHEEEM